MALLALLGCNRPAPVGPRAEAPPVETVVRVVAPEKKTVRHPIEQPGFNVEAYQETLLYTKVAGYVRTWKFDIGDDVKKGDVLAELYAPEMEVDLLQKEAAVRQAEAHVDQAKAAVLTAQAQADRSKSQYDRLAKVGKSGVLDPDSVDEMRLGHEAARAGVAKARADVAAAEASVEVAEAHRDYSQTMLQYLTVRAPFKGVVTQRNVNAGDFVQPAGAGARGKPLYVVREIDPVRVFVNVPAVDAPWIKDGDAVTLRLQGAGGEVFQGKLTRNARSLDPVSRTLRTEIDLPNENGKLLPGMYVQATILVQHAKVWTLPASAVVTAGDQTFCFRVVDGKAIRMPLEVGLRGGGLVELLRKQTKPAADGAEGEWEAITGEEAIVAADAAGLTDGQVVRVEKGKK